MHIRRSPRVVVVLAAFVAGTAFGYVCRDAARSGNRLVQLPAARAGEVEASEALPRVSRPEQKASPRKSGPEKTVRRFGQVIGLKPDKKIIYNMLHAHPWEPINEMIKSCNIRNYSIYETELDGKLYLFAYFEYTGDNFEADMARMGKDEITQQWWKLTDPCQIRLPGTAKGEQWKGAEEVYHLD